MTLRIFTFLAILLFSFEIAAAQNKNDISLEMQSALENNDLETALSKANTLYELTAAQNDFSGAGKAAFSRAKIQAGLNNDLEAAKSYALCNDNYGKVNALAQSIHCQFESGKAYLAAGRPGLGKKTIENTEKSLRKIGQEQSGMAALVYLKLSELSLPPKLDNTSIARAKRSKSIKYSEKALIALNANGQGKSETYLFTLIAKGIALEDSEEYEKAAKTFEAAIRLHKEVPNAPKNILKNAKIHLSISEFNSKKSKQAKKDEKTIEVLDKSGNEIILKIKRKKRVNFPKINKNQLVDGAQVKAIITLAEDGSVTNIQITESAPKKAFGVAFTKAVKTWKFTAPESYSGLDIPPFEYVMVFYVNRR